VSLEHLSGNLCVARLVGSDETELVASEGGHQTVEQEKGAHEDEQAEFAGRDGVWMVPETAEQARRCAFIPRTGSGGLLKIGHFGSGARQG
jgi:hypothetical protein